MDVFTAIFGASRDGVWEQLAAELGGRIVRGEFALGSSALQIPVGHWILTLDVKTENKVAYTRMRAPFVNRERFMFTVYNAGFFADVARLFGSKDIEIGLAPFDDQFVVQSNHPAKVQWLLRSGRVAELIQRQPDVHFSVLDDGGWLGGGFPAGVDQLTFRIQGHVRDLGTLRSLYELFAETLQALHFLEHGQKDPMQQLRDAVGEPGGRITQDGVVLWDGEARRINAVRVLGEQRDQASARMLAWELPGAVPPLAYAILYALGQIGDARAAAHTTPFLAETRPGWEIHLRHAAAVALRGMGRPEQAAAFVAVLAGQMDRLEALEPAWKGQWITAFARALGSKHPDEAAGAARALAHWGAVETLPAIKDAYRRLRGHHAYAAVDAAIQQLEKHTSLPRPVATPLTTDDSLPIPARKSTDHPEDGSESDKG